MWHSCLIYFVLDFDKEFYHQAQRAPAPPSPQHGAKVCPTLTHILGHRAEMKHWSMCGFRLHNMESEARTSFNSRRQH